MTCQICGKKVLARGLCHAHYQKQWRKGLSPLEDDKRSAPIEDRFLCKVKIDDNGCWIWTGTLSAQGYGMIWKEDRNVPTHRESYKLFFGKLSDKDVVCHKCDVRACVNPDHLFVGDRGDNNRDMFEKKRHRFGERSPHAKLSLEDVFAIMASKETNTHLSKLYGVNQSTISRVRAGGRWKTALTVQQNPAVVEWRTDEPSHNRTRPE